MKGDIYLKPKEARRVHILEQLISGVLTIPQAAQLLGLSDRQVQRLKGGYIREGEASLIHNNRGRKPKHAVPDSIRQRVVHLALADYRDASCQHFAELLDQFHNIQLSPKTIGRILKQAGIPLRFARRQPRRRRSRKRMPRVGLLLQFDASPYAWLEERGPRLNLHGGIDDASGKITGLRFELQECLLGYLHILDQTIRRHGIPGAIYSDLHTIFFSPKRDKLTIEDELAGVKLPLTQFGRALSQLGIEHIPARSPQAKGRIERLWATLQARLVLELRIAGISTLEAANAFLPDFIERFNRQFAVEPADPVSAFRSAPDNETLTTIIAWHDNRRASHGSTISFDKQEYQLVTPGGDVVSLKPKAAVTVVRCLNGDLVALYNGHRYALRPYVKPPKAASIPKPVSAQPQSRKPDPSHPWRKPFSSKCAAESRVKLSSNHATSLPTAAGG